MLVVVIGSKGSPGTTTVSLALATAIARLQRPTVLCEADEDGGDLAIRLGISVEPGLVALAADSRHGYDERVGIANAARTISDSLSLVTAPVRPSIAGTAIRQVSPALIQHAQLHSEQFLVVDAGRFRPAGAASGLVDAADTVVVVCRPSADNVLHLEEELSPLTRSRAELVIVGDKPSRPEEVERLLGFSSSTSLPLESKAIEALYGGASSSERLHRRLYMRAIDTIAQRLANRDIVVDVDNGQVSV